MAEWWLRLRVFNTQSHKTFFTSAINCKIGRVVNRAMSPHQLIYKKLLPHRQVRSHNISKTLYLPFCKRMRDSQLPSNMIIYHLITRSHKIKNSDIDTDFYSKRIQSQLIWLCARLPWNAIASNSVKYATDI